MTNVLLIHGLEGNGNENWFPWLREKLSLQGYNVITPRFPTPDNQSLESWMGVFEGYKKYLNEDSIMVGHSLGCPFILDLLETINVKIKSAFLVAPFANLLGIEYVDNLNKTFVDKKFDWNKIKENGSEFYIYYSDNDPYIPEKEAIEILKNTQGIERRVNNAGHFNLKAGYDKFELLLEDIERYGEKNMNEFDIKAPNWDSDPAKVERAKRVAEVIKKTICLTKDMTAFEYGCGTGLLSLNLYPYLNNIYLADSAEGMLSVL